MAPPQQVLFALWVTSVVGFTFIVLVFNPLVLKLPVPYGGSDVGSVALFYLMISYLLLLTLAWRYAVWRGKNRGG